MKLKAVFLIFILLVGLSASLAPLESGASSGTELERRLEQARREREALTAEQRRLQVELDAVSKQTSSLAGAVKSLDATRRKLANDLSLTQAKINSSNLNLRMLESSMEDKAKQIESHRQAIASTIKLLADYSSRSLVLDILTYDKLSDLWSDEGRLGDFSERLQDEIQLLRQTRTLLSSEKVMTEQSRKELLGLHVELDVQKTVVEESRGATEKLLSETRNKEAEYQRMLAENLRRQKEFEDELFRYEAALKMNIDPTAVPAPRPGILSWPLDNVTITQRFGRTVASGRLYASGTHNGVDFRAAMGTQVKAMLTGVVEGIGNTDEQRGCFSYGRWILIKHPNGLTSIYSHLSGSLVKTGQVVKTGEVIGFSGGMPGAFGAGYSTGPHLHVGLFASQGVQIRQFVTSNNCKQVFVPMADAQAYLDPLAYLPAGQ
jgi:murein DD-endopeptidase MepM/ murein hydrolase activator NlpD